MESIHLCCLIFACLSAIVVFPADTVLKWLFHVDQEEELLPDETKQEGAVGAKTYLAYIRSFHNLGMGLLVVFLYAACQVSNGTLE